MCWLYLDDDLSYNKKDKYWVFLDSWPPSPISPTSYDMTCIYVEIIIIDDEWNEEKRDK